VDRGRAEYGALLRRAEAARAALADAGLRLPDPANGMLPPKGDGGVIDPMRMPGALPIMPPASGADAGVRTPEPMPMPWPMVDAGMAPMPPPPPPRADAGVRPIEPKPGDGGVPPDGALPPPPPPLGYPMPMYPAADAAVRK
jgi:hypothetical protein